MELKPCPYCGGEAERGLNKRDNRKIHGIYYRVAEVRCTRCTATVRQACPTTEEAYLAAEREWNRRYEPPNEPLTLEELHEMGEEPIWIEAPDMPNLHGWAINYGLDPDVMHIQYAEIGLDVYGKTWLAYRRRPEEGTK